MPRFTHLLSMIREGRSWNPTEADEPKTKPEKPGTLTIDKPGLPAGLTSSDQMPHSNRASSTRFPLHAPNSPYLIRSPSRR